MEEKVIEKLEYIIKLVEIFICIIILIGVLAGIPDLISYVTSVIKMDDPSLSYEMVNEFLRHSLLLVVGIELVEMIITRSHESILTLILFVIARKMLVLSDGMSDILLASISIGIIFLIIKFVAKDDNIIAKLDNSFSASVPLEKISMEYDINVPVDMANTIGGLVYELAKLEDIEEIKENTSFSYGSYTYKVISMKEGVIERVRIDENK